MDFTSSGWFAGETVIASAVSAIPPGGASGAAVDSKVASSAGSVTFTGLVEGARYIAVGQTSGRRARFTAPRLAEQAAIWARPIVGTGTDIAQMIAQRVAAGINVLNLPALPIGTFYDQTAANLAVPADFTIKADSWVNAQVLVRNANDQVVVAWGQRSTVENVKFIVAGHNTNAGLGVDPSVGLVRMSWDSHSTARGCKVQGFWAPFFLISDHITLEENELVGKNFLGMIRVAVGSSNGNLHTRRNYWTGATFAAHVVADGAQEDSWHSEDDHFGFAPFCLYAINSGGSDTTIAYSNISARSFSLEAWGNRAIHLGKRRMSGYITMPRSGKWALNGGDNTPGITYYTTSTQYWTLGVANNHDYAVTSGNIAGLPKAGNGNLLELAAAGGDDFNGPLVGGGNVGVFQVI